MQKLVIAAFAILYMVAAIVVFIAPFLLTNMTGAIATIIGTIASSLLACFVFGTDIHGEVFENWEDDYLSRNSDSLRFIYEQFIRSMEARNQNVWSLGSILMPLSFLIFTWTLVNRLFDPLLYLSLMASSLVVYGFWLIQLVRANLFNELGYSHIKRIERQHKFSVHEYYGKWRDRIGLVRWTKRGHEFYYILFVALVALWIIVGYGYKPIIGP
jgi:hypothetical protein